ANYIIDDQTKLLDMRFLTVNKKLLEAIDSNIKNYIPRGARQVILEGEYFYFLNDFSKYPGFRPGTQDKFKRTLNRKIKKTLNTSEDVNRERKEIWDKITQYSYYD